MYIDEFLQTSLYDHLFMYTWTLHDVYDFCIEIMPVMVPVMTFDLFLFIIVFSVFGIIGDELCNGCNFVYLIMNAFHCVYYCSYILLACEFYSS